MEQRKNKLNIALLSPLENAYSETFVRAHKKYLEGNILYYYGGLIPRYLEGYGFLGDDPIESLEHSFIKNKVDVILAEFGYTAAESLPAIKNANIPLVVHFHGMDAHRKDILENHRDAYRDFFMYAPRIIVVSQDMKKQIIGLGCPEDKVVYAVYGPNEEFFDIQPDFENRQFLAIGRFVDKKAPYYSILAFKKALDKYPDAKLKMAGDGILLDTCKNLVRYLDIQKNVEFVGVLDRDGVKKEMAQSLAFIQHSITAENGDSEGTPVAIIESGAASLPVISTRHAGIKDVVINEKTGLLVDEHDVAGMTNCMLHLLGDKNLARTLGNKARDRVRNEFSMQNHIDKLNEAIGFAYKNFKGERTGINKYKKDENEKYFCSICGSRTEFGDFGDPIRQNVQCLVCGSLERHRFLYYVYQMLFLNDERKIDLLHMAPEKCLHDVLTKKENVNYIAADLDSSRYSFTNCLQENFTNLSFVDKSFDIILTNHILEHIASEEKYLSEMRRCLKDDGYIVLSVPFKKYLAKTLEDETIQTDEERKRVYGQEDHVRLYGADVDKRLENAGFLINQVFTGIFPDDFVESNKLESNDSESKISGGYFILRKKVS